MNYTNIEFPAIIEENERFKDGLRKIANNPILNDETKEAIRFAVYRIDDVIWLRKQINDLKEQIENMKVRFNNESI